MKKLLISLFILVYSLSAAAQDDFQSELFSADLVLKYRPEIGLSETQVTNVKKIYDANISEFNSLKWDLDAALVAFNKILALPKVDEKASMAQMDKVMTLEDKLKRIRLGMLISIKNELSPSQQSQLKKLRTDSDIRAAGVITPINENPRVMLKVDGGKGDGQPLYIIRDSKGERRVRDVKGINPDDIKSVNVLKNESAPKAYGEAGKNGVVIIEIKGGV